MDPLVNERRKLESIGNAEGSIIAIIMESHINKNMADADIQFCPGILIHIIDICHPPGICMLPDMERMKYMVAETLAQKTNTPEM